MLASLTSGDIRESGQHFPAAQQLPGHQAMTAAPAPTQSKGDSPVTVADERVAQAPGAPEAGTPETKQRSTLLTGISRWNAKITAKKQKKRKTSQTAVVLDAVYDDLPGLTASELRGAGFSLRDRIRPDKDGGVSRAAFVALAPTIAKWPTGDQERWTKEAVSLVAAVRSMREAGERAEVRAAKGCEIPNFKGSYLGRFPLVLADLWTSDHLSERSRSVDAFSGTRARGTLMLKRH